MSHPIWWIIGFCAIHCFELGSISHLFLPTGGSMGPGYVLLFYIVKSHNISNNRTNTEVKEKNKRRLKIFRMLGVFFISMHHSVHPNKKNQFLLDKISQWFLVTSKLFSGRNVDVFSSAMYSLNSYLNFKIHSRAKLDFYWLWKLKVNDSWKTE